MPDPSISALDLWQRLVRARAAWAHERLGPQSSHGRGAHERLVAALEAYVRSLAERGRPVPYALRDELRLQRSVLRNGAARGEATPRGD